MKAERGVPSFPPLVLGGPVEVSSPRGPGRRFDSTRWAQTETESGDILFLWQVSEDGQVDHWAVAGTATEAMRQVCPLIDEGDPDEIEELVCKKVTEERAQELRLYDDGDDTRMLQAMQRETGPSYFACSEF